MEHQGFRRALEWGGSPCLGTSVWRAQGCAQRCLPLLSVRLLTRPQPHTTILTCPLGAHRAPSPGQRLASRGSSRCSPESGPGGPPCSRRVRWAFFTSASRAQRPRGLSSLLASRSCPARGSRSCPRTRSLTCRYAWPRSGWSATMWGLFRGRKC